MKGVFLFYLVLVMIFVNFSAVPAQSTPDAKASTPTMVPASITSADQSDDKYRIGFQDTLEIQVFRHPELAQRVGVNSNGTINLFRIDRPVLAVCKTERELADEIARIYEKDYLRNPFVNVTAVEQKSRSVAVIGAVEKPGSFFINRRVHLLELLAFAGGPKTEEVGSRLLVARTGGRSGCAAVPENAETDIQLMDFKLRDIQEGKQTLWMEAGDVVSVLDADLIYVYGNVNKQGALKVKEPITLTQAIVLAEGLQSAAKKDKIRILRQKPGSTERDELVFSLDEIDKRKVKDPYLEPNDVVAVSEDKVKSILNGIGRSLTQGIPNIFYKVPL